MADDPQSVVVDANHPHVKALVKGGFSLDRLTKLIQGATNPITHEAVSKAQSVANQDIASNIANETAQQQAVSQIPNFIPPLYQSPSMAPIFQQMLQSIITPPVPDNPNIPFTPLAGQQANG